METFLFARSSNLESADYDPETEDLSITFQSGGTYTYHGVPPSVYRGLTLAGSAGQFFHRNIKDSFDWDQE